MKPMSIQEVAVRVLGQEGELLGIYAIPKLPVHPRAIQERSMAIYRDSAPCPIRRKAICDFIYVTLFEQAQTQGLPLTLPVPDWLDVAYAQLIVLEESQATQRPLA